MLAGGKYQFSGIMRGEVVAKRGLKWLVRCRFGKKEVLALSDPLNGRDGEWMRFKFDFELPEVEDCNAQSLVLVLDARSPSEQFARGEMMIDELKLVRTGDLEAPAKETSTEPVQSGGAASGKVPSSGPAALRGVKLDGLTGRFVPD